MKKKKEPWLTGTEIILLLIVAGLMFWNVSMKKDLSGTRDYADSLAEALNSYAHGDSCAYIQREGHYEEDANVTFWCYDIYRKDTTCEFQRASPLLP